MLEAVFHKRTRGTVRLTKEKDKKTDNGLNK